MKINQLMGKHSKIRSKINSELKYLLKNHKYQQFIELFDPYDDFKYKFNKSNFDYIISNVLIDEVLFFKKNNLIKISDIIDHIIDNMDSFKIDNIMVFINELKIHGIIKFPSKGDREYYTYKWNGEYIYRCATYCNIMKIKQLYDEYNKDCFNTFVNTIEKEHENNPIFDMNIIEYEIKMYYYKN